MAQLESLTRLAKVFTDPSCDIEARKKATDAIKDSQELWHTKEYRRFLEVFFDPLVSQLKSTPPQLEDSELHKLRHSVLEVLSKLPPNDVLRPYMPRLLELCLELLRNDNQANGVLAMRVLLDLNKNLVRSQVAGFEGQFNECVAFIEKLFPQLAKARVPALLPSMVAAACLRGPELSALPGVPAALWEREQQRRDREASQRAARGSEGQLLPEEKWREQVNDKWREQVLAAVADLKVAQHLSSLLLICSWRTAWRPSCSARQHRGAARAAGGDALRAHRAPEGACFAGVIDDVLAEGVLLGSSMASMEALRPLSSTCVRLSLNLVECLYQAFKRPDADLAAKKLAQACSARSWAALWPSSQNWHRATAWLYMIRKHGLGHHLRVSCLWQFLQGPGEKEKEINDCKLIVQNIVFGAKTLLFSILYCTRHYHNVQQHEAAKAAALAAGQPMPAMSHSPPPVGMPEEDVRTCAQLLVAGLSCLKVAAFFGEGKEFCEHFAEIFTVMDPRDFTDVFSVRMGTLFDIMVADADALTVAAHLVQSGSVGRVFNALLANGRRTRRSAGAAARPAVVPCRGALLVQKLFRLVFLGLTLADGEQLLVPTLVSL
ncbi:hypothetical protein COO60DRAFT_1464415, partial [Scenedesmus sp. NREL 46B-D3]